MTSARWFVLALIFCLGMIAGESLATPAIAAPLNSPFLQKWNGHAVEMNKLRDLLQQDIADRKQFARAFQSFETLVADPGWLK
jgi:hypothetical protein